MTTAADAPAALREGRAQAAADVADWLRRFDPYAAWQDTGDAERRRLASHLLWVRWRLNLDDRLKRRWEHRP